MSRGPKPKGANRPTITDVAAAVGVSRATVSRAFGRPDILSAETVARVKAAAEKLGYTPNHVARALSTGRHGNIALIVPDVANPFFPPLIRAAQEQVDAARYCLFLGNSDEEAAREDVLLARFSGQVEGMVLVSSRLSDARIREHAARKSLVLVNRDVAGIPRVLIDTAGGMAAAVDHLAGLGHRRIVYVSGPAASWSNEQRRLAMRRAAKSYAVEAVSLPAVSPTFEAGKRAVRAIRASGATAAIAFDDLTAQGVMAGLAAEGVRVPEDFSLVGCDDVLGAITSPPLTSISSRSREAGQIATDILFHKLQQRGVHDVRYVLETHLVVRASTAPARRRPS